MMDNQASVPTDRASVEKLIARLSRRYDLSSGLEDIETHREAKETLSALLEHVEKAEADALKVAVAAARTIHEASSRGDDAECNHGPGIAAAIHGCADEAHAADSDGAEARELEWR